MPLSSSVLLLFALYAATIASNVFIEQPQPVLAPIGKQVQLRCSVFQEYGVRWTITTGGGSPISTADTDSVASLGSLGIMALPSSITAQESVLTIDGTESNNGTTVVCIAALLTDTTMRCSSEEVQVILYGPPSAPGDPVASENGVGSLNISWPLVTREEVEVNFTVTVTTKPMVMSGIQDQHYIFTIEDSTSCDLYFFQVTAVNGAGEGTSSQIITKRLPSLPDISPVQDSLRHSLVKTASGVTLSVTFNGATSCPDYPVTSHTLVLLETSTGDMEMISLEETSDGGVSLLGERELKENSQYSFHVVVTNDVGKVQSTPVQIITTDVQGVAFTRLLEEDTYSIQCSYLNGSDVNGCVYVLVSREEEVENVTGFIERDSNGVTLEVDNIGCYSEVLAYYNITRIPVRTSITNDTCPRPTTGGTNIIVIVVPIVVFFVILFLFVLVMVVIPLAVPVVIQAKKGYVYKSTFYV